MNDDHGGAHEMISMVEPMNDEHGGAHEWSPWWSPWMMTMVEPMNDHHGKEMLDENTNNFQG